MEHDEIIKVHTGLDLLCSDDDNNSNKKSSLDITVKMTEQQSERENLLDTSDQVLFDKTAKTPATMPELIDKNENKSQPSSSRTSGRRSVYSHRGT